MLESRIVNGREQEIKKYLMDGTLFIFRDPDKRDGHSYQG